MERRKGSCPETGSAAPPGAEVTALRLPAFHIPFFHFLAKSKKRRETPKPPPLGIFFAPGFALHVT
ncbi:MAG: hypothetical protein WA280_13005, partial [Xanthobacteraceae bacterium]